MSRIGDLILLQRQRLSGRNAQLPLTKSRPVIASVWVLDLQARIHLDEVPGGVWPKLAARPELDCASTAIADRLHQIDGRLGHLRPEFRRHTGAGFSMTF